MKTTEYHIKETFQSPTLRERKRNFQRQMEEYIFTILRRQNLTISDPLTCVASTVPTTYNKGE